MISVRSKTPEKMRATALALAVAVAFMAALVCLGEGQAEGAASRWVGLSRLRGVEPLGTPQSLPVLGAASSSGLLPLMGSEANAPSFTLVSSETLQGDGTRGPYMLSRTGVSKNSITIYVGGVPISPSTYVVDESSGTILFFDPPPRGSEVHVSYRYSQQPSRSTGALDLAGGPLGLLSLTHQVSLGLLYTEGEDNLNLPQVRGAIAQYDGGSFMFGGGLFASAATAKARASYMRERLAELCAVADSTSLDSRSLPSQSRGGEAIPMFMRLRSGALTTEAKYWAVDDTFMVPGDSSAARQSLLNALESGGAPTNDWNQLRGFRHFQNGLSLAGSRGLSFSQGYSLDSNRQTGHGEFGLSWLNSTEAFSFGGDGDRLKTSWNHRTSKTSWEDPSREGGATSLDNLDVSLRLGNGTLSHQSKAWQVGSTFNSLPSGGSMPASAQSVVAALQGLGAPAGDWNQVRGFGHSESSLRLDGIAGLSLYQGRTVDANEQAGHGEFGLTWSNLGQRFSLGRDSDAFRASFSQTTSQASWKDSSKPESGGQVHNLQVSQRLGGRMSLSFNEKGWKVDPSFNLPNWSSTPPSAQALIASLKEVGAPAGDWNQVRGLQHEEKSLGLRTSSLLSVNRTYYLDRNEIPGHADFGLNRETHRDSLSLKSRDGAFQAGLGRTDGLLTWEDGSRVPTRLHVEDATFTQRFGRDGNLGYTQVIDTSTDVETQDSRRVRKSTYTLANLPVLQSVGLRLGGTFEERKPNDASGTKTMTVGTAGPGLKLAPGLSLQANYQEAKTDGQGSTCSFGLSTTPIALNSAVKIDSLQFVRSINATDAETKQTNLNWTAKATSGLNVSGQFQATEADGQGYGFNRTFALTQKVSDKTSLVGTYMRQQNNEQRITATKRLALTRNDPQNRFTYSAIYDEMVDPQVQSVIRPVFDFKGALANGKGASVAGKYIQRDQADNTRLVTKELHATLPLDSRFSLQGDYVMNPHDPNKRDQIQSLTVNERWALTGKVGRKANLTCAYTTAENLQSPSETDTTDVTLTLAPSQKESFSAGFRLAKNYAPGSASSHQGFLANYTKNVDDNHFLRISATDEVDNVGFVNGMTRSTSPTDTRYQVEFGTTF